MIHAKQRIIDIEKLTLEETLALCAAREKERKSSNANEKTVKVSFGRAAKNKN